jgi:aminoglycoside phosphotransferase
MRAPTTRAELVGPDLDDRLAGRLGASALREMVHDPLRHGLADLLRACLPAAEELGDPLLLRSKFKAGHKLTAYYRLGAEADARPLALSWCATPATDLLDAAETQGRAAASNASQAASMAPFARLTARSDDGRTGLLIAPLDPQLPQLMRLDDHAYVRSLVERLTGTPQALPSRLTAVRYRPGQRHVLQVVTSPTTLFLKIDRDHRGARAVRFAEVVGPRLTARVPSAELVPPIGYGVVDQVAVWRGLPGPTLSMQLRAPARAATSMALLGEAIRALHELDPRSVAAELGDAGSAPLHLVSAELSSTLGAGSHLAALVPALSARFRELAGEAVEHLDRLPAEDARIGHGDLKCDNLIASDGRIWLLDLDRTGLAEPALDLGKLLADLAWWGRHHAIDVRGVVAAFLEGYGPCGDLRLARARLVAVLFGLKLAARRTPVHIADFELRVRDQVDEAAARLRAETGR